MADHASLRHYAVKIVNPDAGKISWFSDGQRVCRV